MTFKLRSFDATSLTPRGGNCRSILPRARSACWTWCGQPIPWASLLQGLRILPRPLGQVTRPVVHQDTPAFEQVRAGIGRLDPVPDHMRQGRLDHLPGMIRRPTNPVKAFTGLYLCRVERLIVPHRSPSINAVPESVLLHEDLTSDATRDLRRGRTIGSDDDAGLSGRGKNYSR